MSFQTIQGQGLLCPRIHTSFQPTLGNFGPIDATGEKVAFTGRVFFPARTGTKSIRRVCFRFGVSTKASGSALTLSLQDITTTSGPPGQPDGTQDQTVAIPNADILTAGGWYRSAALSADRSVSNGDLLAVVVEFDGSGRLGADTIQFQGYSLSSSSFTLHNSTALLMTGGTWAVTSTGVNVVLEFSDGTFGTMYGATVFSASNTHAYNSGTAGADEHAAVINFPWPVKVDGLYAGVFASGSSADFDLVLYSGTTALQTVSIDANTVYTTAGPRYIFVGIPETTLSANTDYYVAIKPTTTNNVTAYSIDVADANHWTTQDGGTAFSYTSRVDAGSWAAKTTTRRLIAGVCISAFDDAVQVGGLLTHPGMAGGMRG